MKMKLNLNNIKRKLKTPICWVMMLAVVMTTVGQVVALNGPNVCLVNQKYNITKRIKYRAPMAVRSYEWCLAIPPRCSKWNTVMKDLTRLETEERTAEVSVCCPGYRMKDVSCVPICPHGKTGHGCSQDCTPRKWGPNCVHDCPHCSGHGACSPTTGECRCQDGWQGESCESSMSTEATTSRMKEILTTTNTPTTYVAITSTPGPITTITTPKGTTTSSIRTTLQETTLLPSVITTVPTTNTKPVTTGSSAYNNSTITTWTSTYNEPYIENTRNYQIGVQKVPKFTVAVNKFSTSLLYWSTSTPKITHVTSATSTTKLETTAVTKEVTDNVETSRKQETTLRTYPTTTKFKPIEIWIKPAQKGESITETKIKPSHEPPSTKHRNTTKTEHITEMTTPRTIIVAIIPTSMSYPSFKKISLTTASTLQTRYKTQSNNTSEHREQTRKIANESLERSRSSTNHSTSTSKPLIIKHFNTDSSGSKISSTINPTLPNVFTTPTTTKTAFARTTKPVYTKRYTTNSMSSMTNDVNTKSDSIQHNYVSESTFTVPSNKPSHNQNVSLGLSSTAAPIVTVTKKPPVTVRSEFTAAENIKATAGKKTTEAKDIIREYVIEQKIILVRKGEATTNQTITTPVVRAVANVESTTNLSNKETNADEERFDILTEPEHITAVVGDRATDRASMDLVSVMSIAGGVMMVVITLAVVIVMMDRCRRRSYDDLRKMNDIRMKVVIGDDVPPPPYVRSIFHTPLPEPPMMDKCHYQPISTLDRNLKQFMRPVVVQNISPIMLENFRGILECHYDHLPRRSQEFRASHCTTSSLAPSVGDYSNSLPSRAHSITDSTIEALKCEAKLEVIDSSTSEPLYAEIPAWKPPLEHAIEIVNMNGEAVTEL